MELGSYLGVEVRLHCHYQPLPLILYTMHSSGYHIVALREVRMLSSHDAQVCMFVYHVANSEARIYPGFALGIPVFQHGVAVHGITAACFIILTSGPIWSAGPSKQELPVCTRIYRPHQNFANENSFATTLQVIVAATEEMKAASASLHANK